MLNLFYEESYWGGASRMNGPQKVVVNLLKSLDQEKIPYAINEEKYKYNFLIHYDYTGHLKHSKLELDYCFIGPQIWFFDQHVKTLQQNPHYYKSLIVPSQWTKDLAIEKFNFPEDKISTWPVGIEIKPYERKTKYDCLVYFKRRSADELKKVTEFLEGKGLSYNVISYGSYSEDQLQNLCDQSRFCFLLNGTESQGIAVQEIMARDVPMLVWDVTHWNDQGPEWSCPATSVPYWSDECGERFFSESEMEDTYQKFCGRIYEPAVFVERELSLKASVNKLLDIFNAN